MVVLCKSFSSGGVVVGIGSGDGEVGWCWRLCWVALTMVLGNSGFEPWSSQFNEKLILVASYPRAQHY